MYKIHKIKMISQDKIDTFNRLVHNKNNKYFYKSI